MYKTVKKAVSENLATGKGPRKLWQRNIPIRRKSAIRRIRSHRFPIRRISFSESFCPCFVPDFRQAPKWEQLLRCYRRGAVERSLSHGFQARHSGNYLGRHTQLVCRIPDSRTLNHWVGPTIPKLSVKGTTGRKKRP